MGEEIPNMTSDEFKYHLVEFMRYMRQMEESLSKNWDVTTNFQEVMTKTVQNMVSELQKNERITNIEKIVDSLQGHMNHVLVEFKESVHQMKNIREAMKDEIEAFAREREKVHRLFDYVSPEGVATRGAEKALLMVKEFKDSYEFLKNVREVLGGQNIESLGKLPTIQSDPCFDLPIGTMRLSSRGQRALKQAGFQTVGDVYRAGRRGLLAVRGLGRTSQKEIDNYFEGKRITWEYICKN